MKIYYGSLMYFAYIGAVLLLTFALYRLLRNRSGFIKRSVVFLIAALNFLQHIFKGQIYPQYNGLSALYLSTAYNVCAFLILVSPFIIVLRASLLRQFIAYVGSFAGMIAMLVPYWFVGLPAFSWEVYRFYICHGLLFISSFLPGLLGIYEFKLKNCFKVAPVFLLALALILLNNAVLIKTGNYPGKNPDNVFYELGLMNPAWSMHPSESFSEIGKLLERLSIPFLCGKNSTGAYIPILWYAIPMYIGITVGACVVYAISKLLRSKKT